MMGKHPAVQILFGHDYLYGRDVYQFGFCWGLEDIAKLRIGDSVYRRMWAIRVRLNCKVIRR